MEPFNTLTAIAAPLPIANVDTDMIVPARFLTTITRAGLGSALFATQREDPGFVLNREPWTKAGIIISLENFGCGSSREHAPWALKDFGIRCIIAESIADIFYNNCTKNGILPIILPRRDIDLLLFLAQDAATAEMMIDLAQQTISAGNTRLAFQIDPERKAALIDGEDDIARSLANEPDIRRYEDRRALEEPWLPRISQQALDGS